METVSPLSLLRCSLMRRFRTLWIAVLMAGLFASAQFGVADSPDESAIKRDRSRIAGTWQVTQLIVNGNEMDAENRERFRVKNGDDGTWTLLADDKVIGGGTSTLDPGKKPKQIDFTLTQGEGSGRRFVGIYKLNDDRRSLCFAAEENNAPDRGRPAEFEAKAGDERILVRFRRIKP